MATKTTVEFFSEDDEEYGNLIDMLNDFGGTIIKDEEA